MYLLSGLSIVDMVQGHYGTKPQKVAYGKESQPHLYLKLANLDTSKINTVAIIFLPIQAKVDRPCYKPPLTDKPQTREGIGGLDQQAQCGSRLRGCGAGCGFSGP